MPHAPTTRPPITTTETWLTAPMTSSRMPRASATPPATGPVWVRFAGAGGPGTGGPGGGGTGAWGADPRGMGAGGAGPGYPGADPGYPGTACPWASAAGGRGPQI